MDAHHGREARREQIERELAANPTQSNREIARKLGVDHKTVAAVRGQMPAPNSPVIPQNDIGEDIGEQVGKLIVGIQMPIRAHIEEDTGYLIISQEGGFYEDEQRIQISPENIAVFMESLAAIVKERK
jgi:hypothetical protein